MATKIEWTDETWNPLIGCTRVGPGCDHCYAISVVHRAMSPQHVGLTTKPDGGPVDWTGEIRFVPEALEKPLRWRRPRRIFVNSLSDLFHPAVSDDYIADVFAVMELAHWHTFQILTKRPQRMAAWVNESDNRQRVDVRVSALLGIDVDDYAPYRHREDVIRLGAAIRNARAAAGLDEDETSWPLPNVWLGTSIESNRYAWRADHLRATPAAVRWVSAEPLLGPLDQLDLTGIDWLVVGGESGPGARPMHPQWVRDLRDRCTGSPNCDGSERCAATHHIVGCFRSRTWDERRPAFLFKQWGAWAPIENEHVRYGEFHNGTNWIDNCMCPEGDGALYRVGKRSAGRVLDGRTWDEYPEVAA